jgi:hypothetical protein
MSRPPVKEVDCPDPSVHGNPFRYCPYCDWRESIASDIDRAIVATFYKQDDWSRVLDALEAYEATLVRIGDEVRRRESLPPYGPWPRPENPA